MELYETGYVPASYTRISDESPDTPEITPGTVTVSIIPGIRIMSPLDNENINAMHGAGPATASLISRAGATEVISGRYGPKAYQALRSLGIVTWVGRPDMRAVDLLADLAEDRLEKA